MGDEESCCGACAYLAEGPHDVVRSRPLVAHTGHPAVTLVVWHAGNVRRIPLAHAARLVIGRDRAADIAIDDPMLSRRTCCLDITPSGEVYVEDLASACGTIVNDGRVNRARLREADTIRIGSSVLRFEIAGRLTTPATRA